MSTAPATAVTARVALPGLQVNRKTAMNLLFRGLCQGTGALPGQDLDLRLGVGTTLKVFDARE